MLQNAESGDGRVNDVGRRCSDGCAHGLRKWVAVIAAPLFDQQRLRKVDRWPFAFAARDASRPAEMGRSAVATPAVRTAVHSLLLAHFGPAKSLPRVGGRVVSAVTKRDWLRQ